MKGAKATTTGIFFARGETKSGRSVEIPLFVRDDNLGLTVISSGARNLATDAEPSNTVSRLACGKTVPDVLIERGI